MEKEDIDKLVKELKIDHVHEWELIEILAFINRNASWRAETLQVVGFDGAEAFNTQELEHSDYKAMRTLAEFLRERIKDLRIIKATVDLFGDEGGPAIIITLVSQEDFDKINNRAMKADDYSYISRALQAFVKNEKLYHIGTVAF